MTTKLPTSRSKETHTDVTVRYMDAWSEMKHMSMATNWVVITSAPSPLERLIATYANLLGSRLLFQTIDTANVQTVIEGLERGLPTHAVDRVTSLMGINRAALSEVLDVSLRTLSRRETLNTSESERLLRISNLFQKALEILGDREEARRWFTTPKKALGGKTPLAFSETDVGAREVEDLLGRIEYGVYA